MMAFSTALVVSVALVAKATETANQRPHIIMVNLFVKTWGHVNVTLQTVVAHARCQSIFPGNLSTNHGPQAVTFLSD